MRMEDGTWGSFMTARIPETIDDEIKKHNAAFLMAANTMSPDELFEIAPLSFPMTHPVPAFPLIAKYPVDAWEEAGAPFFDEDSWIKFGKAVAKKDLRNLDSLFKVCEKEEENRKKKRRLAEEAAVVMEVETT